MGLGWDVALDMIDYTGVDAERHHSSAFTMKPPSTRSVAAVVLPLIGSGEITPAHDRSFLLAQAPEALRHLIEDRPFGTVTLSVGAEPFR